MRCRSVHLSVVLLMLFSAVASAQQPEVREAVLPNGLKVLTKEVHAAPVVSFQVWYRVGSRNEQLGKTGLSHLLEHMQFKGTKSLKKGEIDKLIQSNGGLSNAATWKDFTFYYETLSSDKLELAMRIESDRMVNSLIDPKEFAAEVTVVRSELEGDEGNPDSLIYYELYANAFKAHPYQWPTIGWTHDVQTVSRDDLYAYYKTFYKPNNATVVIVGDFETEKALALVNKYFGKIKKGPDVPQVTSREPVQFGERRAVATKAGNAYRVMMGFHNPAIGSPDVYPLDVLEIALSEGMSSRLYRALVDKQLATEAWASNTVSRDPDLFLLGGTARDGVKIEDVESALLAEVEKIKSEGITDQELQKAVNLIEASFVYGNDSVSNQARMLGNFETMYSWKYLDEYLPNLRKVSREDVSRAARKYLTAENRTVVKFVPAEPGVRSQESEVGAEQDGLRVRVPAYRPADSPLTPTLSPKGRGGIGAAPAKSHIPSPKSAVAPTRLVLENGVVAIFYPNRSNATIGVTGSLNAGAMFDPEGKSGVAALTAGLLVKGTKSRTADQLASERDFLGIRMSAGADTESMSFSTYSLAKHFDKSLELLSDVLRNPVFPDEELQKIKARRLSGLKQQQDDPQSLAFRRFYGMVFPRGHPYHQLSLEEEAANTSAISRNDIVSFYEKYYGPQTAIIVVVGDADEQTALAKIRQYFGDWKPTGPAVKVEIPEAPIQGQVVKDVIRVPDKTQVDVVLGYSGGLKRTDADFYAATVMNHILGGGGALGSRMGDVIRDQMGLVYNVYSAFEAQLGAGSWHSYLGTNPQNLDKAVTALVEQMKLMQEKGATKQEVREAVDYIAGSFPARRLETSSAIAATLHGAEFYGLGMDYLREYQSLYRAVTVEQVNAAARKYLHPERYTLVQAGTLE
ncbi:MAG: insulinase family protein [Armatimonadetes bacterium]|nr:insulinase family protein [Armatimonadota bacterium]